MATPKRNIDPSEIVKFAAMADRWWDRNGAFGALHDINAERVGYIAAGADLAGKRVLDVGCGGGILSEALAGAGARVTGIDAADAPLAAARIHMRSRNLTIDYRKSTAEAFADSHPGRFHVVACMELLEHVPDPASVVHACARLVQPGGRVFFATLNRNPLSFLLAIGAAEYLLSLVPRGTHRYHRFIKPVEMIRWARDAGLRTGDVCGLHYLPLVRRCVLGGPTWINYMARFARP